MSGFYLNQPDEYFTDIEDAISRQRGKRYQANPLDWATMQAWKDRGIPVHLVLRVVDKSSEIIRSLSYHTAAVENSFTEYLKSHTGAPAIESPVICEQCFDTGEVVVTDPDAEFTWQLKFISCEVCK